MEEPRPAASRRPADGTFSDPAFIDQLIDDGRHGAALQARSSRQVGARQRVVAADEVERDAAIDLARGLTRRHPEIGEIDLAHRFPADLVDEVVVPADLDRRGRRSFRTILLAPRTILAPCQFVN
jgi:hypothetical protein